MINEITRRIYIPNQALSDLESAVRELIEAGTPQEARVDVSGGFVSVRWEEKTGAAVGI